MLGRPCICVAPAVRPPISRKITASFQPITPRSVLLIDATNVLCAAAADRKRWSHGPGDTLAAALPLWLDYLAAAAAAHTGTPPHATVAVFDNPRAHDGKRSARSAVDASYLRRRQIRLRLATPPDSFTESLRHPVKLKPYMAAVQGRGGVALCASQGIEADDVIGAACAFMQGLDSAVHIIIASADSDMQQHISPHVSWLQLLTPTKGVPAGYSVMTEEAFLKNNAYSPAAYGDWLAMVGKKEASVGGIGVGPGAAKKLLRSFGTIEGITAAAAEGQLAGWSPTVQKALQPGSAGRRKLDTNTLVLRASKDPAALTDVQRQDLEAAVARLNSHLTAPCRDAPAAAGGGAEAVAWLYPRHARRWKYVQPLAELLAAQLREEGLDCEVKAVMPSGFPVDLLVRLGPGLSRAVFICCPLDFSVALDHAALEPPIAPAAQLLAEVLHNPGAFMPAPPGLDAPLQRRLLGSLQHYLGLVRWSASNSGLGPPELIPWWHIAADVAAPESA